MARKEPPKFTILGISPTHQGFGFAVLEPKGRLVAWGVARLYSKKLEEFHQRLDGLFDKYHVRVLCVEGLTTSNRRQKARRMIMAAVRLGHAQKREVVQTSITSARLSIGIQANEPRRHMAVKIAEMLPDLETVLPEVRKPWQSEDQRMRIFEAAALAVARIGC